MKLISFIKDILAIVLIVGTVYWHLSKDDKAEYAKCLNKVEEVIEEL
jgi:hypothetical protein